MRVISRNSLSDADIQELDKALDEAQGLTGLNDDSKWDLETRLLTKMDLLSKRRSNYNETSTQAAERRARREARRELYGMPRWTSMPE